MLENSDAVPISGLRRWTKGKTMNDPEVARLRRLRSEALRVRELALALGSTQSADDRLLARGACTGWRIARVVSGRLKAHPYLRYQRGVSLGSIVANRLFAGSVATITKDRLQGLRRAGR